MASLDLRSYGINTVFRKDSPELFVIHPESLFDRASLHRNSILLGGKEYDIEDTLGRGTFGVTYLVRNNVGKAFACKVIRDIQTNKQCVAFFKECLINIILAETSKDMMDGPFVPRIIRIGYNSSTYEAFILSEPMRNTLDNVISSYSPKENDIIIPDAVQQIAQIIGFFGRKLNFNHRDLKGDNIMYVKNKDGKRLYRLIDFGFSCITWNGIKVEGSGYLADSPTCYKKDRDLSQLIYSLLRYNGTNMTFKLYKYLSDVIVANVGRHKCRMEKDCPRNGLRGWRNTYDFLNRHDVSVPKAEPLLVMKHMLEYGKKTRKQPRPKPEAECPPGTIRNPKTGRCVKETGAVGKKLKAPLEAPPPCPPGKIRNPKTRRCVKENGAVAKRLLE